MNTRPLKNCIVATHSSDIAGPPDHLIKHLQVQADLLITLKFPLSPQDLIRPEYKVYKKGELIEESRSTFLFKPFILNYLKDFFLTIYWSIKLKRKYKLKEILFFGCNNFLANSGLILRFFKQIKSNIFYAIDYSDTRFANKLLNNIYLWIDKNAAVRSDFVWSNTNRTRKIRSEQGVKEERNLLTRNGAWLDEIKLAPEIQKISLPIKIEYHGYIAESKGVQNIIKALELINNPNFKLDIIGYGPYESTLKEIANQSKFSKQITFLGKKQNKEILGLLSEYDLCINLINPKEDYLRYCDPMKVREALSSNLPVLVSSLPEVAEEIKTQNLGLVVENSEDIEEIANELNKIFENPKLLVDFKKNISKIRTNFGWDTIYNNALSAIKN